MRTLWASHSLVAAVGSGGHPMASALAVLVRPYRARLVARYVEDTLEANEWTVSQLAEEAGVSPNVVRRLTRREGVGLDSLVTVLRVCGYELCVRPTPSR